MTDFYESLKSSIKNDESIVVGTITRVIDRGDDRPLLFFSPETDVRHLNLEGHRVATGELISEHGQRNVSGPVPHQFDLKRVAFEGDGPKVGEKVAFIHLDRQR